MSRPEAEPSVRLISLTGNNMKLDGGAMFGNAPKALWSRWMAADDRNMIHIGSKSLLVRTPHYNILFETGAGAYLSPQMKKRFQVAGENHMLLLDLKRHGLDPEQITHVILSHLHFDHAGGLLAPWEEGREGLALAFPNARFITGRGNFERSRSPHHRDRASFIPGLADLLADSGRLELKSAGDELSLDSLAIRFTESHGHTPGMLVSWIRSGSFSLVFTGDLVPAHPWVNLPITMGYDRFAEGLVDEKQAMLDQAYQEGALLVYPHDPVCAASYLAYDEERQRFVPRGRIQDLDMRVDAGQLVCEPAG